MDFRKASMYLTRSKKRPIWPYITPKTTHQSLQKRLGSPLSNPHILMGGWSWLGAFRFSTPAIEFRYLSTRNNSRMAIVSRNSPTDFRKWNMLVEFYAKYTDISPVGGGLRSFVLLLMRSKRIPLRPSKYRFFYWSVGVFCAHSL